MIGDFKENGGKRTRENIEKWEKVVDKWRKSNYLVALGVELRASHLLDRGSTTWATLPAPEKTLNCGQLYPVANQSLKNRWTSISLFQYILSLKDEIFSGCCNKYSSWILGLSFPYFLIWLYFEHQKCCHELTSRQLHWGPLVTQRRSCIPFQLALIILPQDNWSAGATADHSICKMICCSS
jgi:hypothetical protein